MPAVFRKLIPHLLMALFVFLSGSHLACAEDVLPSKEAVPVVFSNRTVFMLNRSGSTLTPEERARIIENRLKDLAENSTAQETSFRLEDVEGETRVLVENKLVATVSDADAAAEKLSRHELAGKWGAAVHNSLQQYYEDRKPVNIAIRVGLSLLTTLAFILFWRAYGWLARRLDLWLQRKLGDSIRVQQFVLLSEESTRILVKSFVRFFLWPARLSLVYGYIYVVLLIFPKTREYANQALYYLWQPTRDIGIFLFGVLPNLVTIIIIIIIAYYILAMIRMFSREIENGSIVVPGFHSEWASPTYTLVRSLVIILAFIAIFPYIPGSNSPIFQGISVFLGLLVSVSSSSTLSNMVAGYVLIFTKAFREGDVVRSGDYTGVVVQRSLLATHIRTFKNENVTIPNSLFLGGSILNFSAYAGNTGVILHTKVTIGYDAPWRKVHELLIQAAARTDGILVDPAPFVFQTSLDDFYVTYELNAYTRAPENMGPLYSDLHHNIQDCFNEGGIEIMSPHYHSLRNGNPTTIPEGYSRITKQ